MAEEPEAPMSLDQARRVLAHGGAGHSLLEVVEASEVVLTYLEAIDRRAEQIRGGLKPDARPREIVAYLLGEEPAPQPGGRIRADQVRIGDIISYSQHGVVDDGKWHTVTEVGPDMSRPGKGWLRICTSRVDEADGQIHRSDGNYSPELTFGFMSRATETD